MKFKVRDKVIANTRAGESAPSSEYLPAKFKLNPAGNEALSKAMQERLFELGYKNPDYGTTVRRPERKWILVGVRHNVATDISFVKPGFESDFDLPTFTLDDLYRLTPAPKEKPKLEIAGRTYELKDGKVVGKDFSHDLSSFKTVLRVVLNRTEGVHHLGGYSVTAVSFKIGCQTVSRDDLERALAWAREVSDEAA